MASITSPVIGKIYKFNTASSGGSNARFEFHKYTGTDSSSNPLFEKVTQYHSNIERKGALAPTTNIYLPSRVSMLELGFSPTFYQFVDTIIEVKISIKYTQEGSYSLSLIHI